jgi:hypothetical protein
MAEVIAAINRYGDSELITMTSVDVIEFVSFEFLRGHEH